MATRSRHLSVHIDRPAAEVYAYACDPTHLPEWAAGLGGTVEQIDGRWYAEMELGRVGIDFTPVNPYGVLDHEVTLPSGEVVYNPMRVIADAAGGAGGCEVVFTVRQLTGTNDADYERDQASVSADLVRLKRVVEGGAAGAGGAGRAGGAGGSAV